jgi:hypothetical protein
VGSGPDLVGPIVTATNPANGLGNVPIDVVIALQLNEPIDSSTVNAATMPVYDNFTGQPIAGTYSVTSDGRKILFAPAAPLGVFRSHNVYFYYSGITDLAGNWLGTGGGQSSIAFTTGSSVGAAGPHILGVSPVDQLLDVPRNAQVIVDFDRAIDTLTANRITLAAGSQPIAVLTGFGNGDSRITLTPIVLLQASTVYTLTIGAVTDLSGVALTPLVQHFTTASGVDLIPPSVTVTSPSYGTANVPTNPQIQVGFSERMDPQTVNGATFVVYPQATGTPIDASYLVAADGRSATLVPAQQLVSLPITRGASAPAPARARAARSFWR